MTLSQTSDHEAHDGHFDGEHVSIDERLILAPCDGKFRPTPPQHFTAEGEYVLEGQKVGAVMDTTGIEVPVVSRFTGWVMGQLALDGQPVTKDQAVLWLRRL